MRFLLNLVPPLQTLLLLLEDQFLCVYLHGPHLCTTIHCTLTLSTLIRYFCHVIGIRGNFVNSHRNSIASVDEEESRDCSAFSLNVLLKCPNLPSVALFLSIAAAATAGDFYQGANDRPTKLNLPARQGGEDYLRNCDGPR